MIVVDASVALKWFIEEEGSDRAELLLDGNTELVAPELIVAEVCNAAWRGLRIGSLSETQFDAAVNGVPGMLDTLIPLTALSVRAAAIARALDHPVYDCF